jgi:hypothetical protein
MKELASCELSWLRFEKDTTTTSMLQAKALRPEVRDGDGRLFETMKILRSKY